MRNTILELSNGAALKHNYIYILVGATYTL